MSLDAISEREYSALVLDANTEEDVDNTKELRFKELKKRSTILDRTLPAICTEYEGLETDYDQRDYIVLSDGSFWEFLEALDPIKETWKKGDDIRIFQEDKTKFILRNATQGTLCVCLLSERISEATKSIFVQEVDSSGYGLKTSDGKCWIGGYWNWFTQDLEGDRVIINKSRHKDQLDYQLYFVESNRSLWVSRAPLFEKV